MAHPQKPSPKPTGITPKPTGMPSPKPTGVRPKPTSLPPRRKP